MEARKPPRVPHIDQAHLARRRETSNGAWEIAAEGSISCPTQRRAAIKIRRLTIAPDGARSKRRR